VGADHSFAKAKEADLTHRRWVLIIAHHRAIILERSVRTSGTQRPL